MNKAQQRQFHTLYQQHVSALQRQGKATTTIDVYSRAVRRVTAFFDQCPDRLTVDQLKIYFTALVKSHSWSTVKVDRNGLQFFFKHVLNKEWIWVDIVTSLSLRTVKATACVPSKNCATWSRPINSFSFIRVFILLS